MITTYKNKIINFYKDNKRMPGYAELMDMTGFKSKNAVYKLINKLVELNNKIGTNNETIKSLNETIEDLEKNVLKKLNEAHLRVCKKNF
jgi:alcohol dehydrogenase class IV